MATSRGDNKHTVILLAVAATVLVASVASLYSFQEKKDEIRKESEDVDRIPDIVEQVSSTQHEVVLTPNVMMTEKEVISLPEQIPSLNGETLAESDTNAISNNEVSHPVEEAVSITNGATTESTTTEPTGTSSKATPSEVPPPVPVSAAQQDVPAVEVDPVDPEKMKSLMRKKNAGKSATKGKSSAKGNSAQVAAAKKSLTDHEASGEKGKKVKKKKKATHQ